jgi:hypothetical protein
MKSLAVIAVCVLIAFWVHKKYEADNAYYEKTAPDRSNMTIAERGFLALEREHDLEIKKAETVLRKYQTGELSQEEYEEYLKRRTANEREEYNQGVEDLGNMFDPEKGMFSGVIKMASNPELKKIKQIEKLEIEIRNVISKMGTDDESTTKMKLHAVKWVPIGNEKIDNEMSEYYETKISNFIKQLSN